MNNDEKRLILEYAELGLKLLPRDGKPPPITGDERERMTAIREELGMEHGEILASGARILMEA